MPIADEQRGHFGLCRSGGGMRLCCYAESRERVRIVLDAALWRGPPQHRQIALDRLAAARQSAAGAAALAVLLGIEGALRRFTSVLLPV